MTTRNDDPIFIDTNVLVYANLALSPFHRDAIDRLTSFAAAGVTLWMSRQIFREYLSAMTRPGLLTGTIPMASLIGDIRSFSTQFSIAEDGPYVTAQLLTLLQQVPSAGRQVHDANIVATMQAHGITRLLTHNTDDFARYAGLITVLPLVPAR
jgi:predicted nucleic acid-binding protein